MPIPTPTASKFREQFPEFTEQDYPAEVVTRWITAAGYIHSISERGWLLLTAHLLSIAKADGALDGVAEPDGGQGLVITDTLGQKTQQFSYGAGMREGQEFYKRTFYGRTFLEIARRRPGKAIGVRVY